MVMNRRARQISFGGVNSADYGAIVDGSESYIAPERDYSSVAVPGRDGELTIDNGRYKNVKLPYNLLFGSARMLEAYRERISALTGYRRLEDSRRPGEYRLARLSGEFKPKMFGAYNRGGQVTLTFDCQPQRFLKSGEEAILFAAPGALHNPSGYAAKPLLRVHGSGTLRLGDVAVTIAEHGHGVIEIDCALGECYSGEINLNKYVSLSGRDFPALPAGETRVAFDGGITKVEIYPRWWRL